MAINSRIAVSIVGRSVLETYLARAILQLAADAAHTRDYDGEQMVGEGVILDDEAALRAIAETK